MGAKGRSFLEFHGGRWRVVIAVPRHLHGVVGKTKLKQPLGTDSLAVANATKWPVIQALQQQLRHANRGHPGDTLLAEALAMREALLAERRSGADGRLTAADLIDLRADAIQGDPIGEHPFTGEAVYRPGRSAVAGQFAAIATGRAMPLTARLDEWHTQAVNRQRRTRGDDVRALGYLAEWCGRNGVAATLEAITRPVAGRFIAELPANSASAKTSGHMLTNRTANKYISSLSGYWKWLKARDAVADNVWAGLSLPKPRVEADDRERPFTRDEMVALLSGTPQLAELAPLMRIAALSGARLDAVVSLRVKDCAGGLFKFKRQKREDRERLVPIHSALTDLVAGLVAGKAPDDDLFKSFPLPRPGTQLERGMPATKAFTAYRKSVGVDDVRPGRRRGLVNFHSFRRWFITEAERAGVPESTIAAVVGHKRDGMTLGLYSAGPALEQFKACVEAVRLPE